MALLVWLPLTGDLRNLGLDDITIVNNGATVDDNGKIGKCYSFNGSNLYLRSTYNFYNTLYSVCAWIYTTSASATQTIICDRTKVGYGFSIFLVDGKIRIDPGLNNTLWKTNYIYPVNTWFHLGVTYGNGKVSYYINGEFRESYSCNINSTYWGDTTSIGASQANNNNYNNYLNGKLNDVRIYDHCLSPKEVKEISKGLILHYKLDYNYNSSLLPVLIFYDYIESSGIQWINTGVNPNLNTRVEMRASLLDAANIAHLIYSNGSGSGTGRYGFMCESTVNRRLRFDFGDSMYNSPQKTLTNGLIFSFSIYKGMSVDGVAFKSNLTDIFSNTVPLTLFAPNYAGTIHVSDWSAKMRLYSCKIYDNEVLIRDFIPCNYNNLIGLWERVEGRFYGNQSSGLFTAGNMVSGDSEIMLEMLNTAYDCSGYGNNATIVGDINIDSISPRYSSAIKFTETTSKIKISDINTLGFSDSYTFAWWGKISTFSGKMFWGFSDGIRLNGIYNGNLWNTGDSSDNPLYEPGTTTQVTAPSVNVWHHFVMVGNGTTCLVYLDGVLWGLAKTYKSISGTTIFLNGWDANANYANNNTCISDFRIYSTALSEEDIKELYDTSAIVDNLGNNYCYLFEELIGNTPQVLDITTLITKLGILSTGQLKEEDIQQVLISEDKYITANQLIEM